METHQVTGDRHNSTTPNELGFRFPAEWEPHEATWIAWPHNKNDWPGKITPIRWVYGEIVRKLALSERVRIILNSSKEEKQARSILTRVGVDLSEIDFFHIPADRSWVRDYGPIFLKRTDGRQEVAVVRFRFNGWAKYEDWLHDNQVSHNVGKALGCKVFPVNFAGCGIVLEGGAIDGNGKGTILSTEECLLDTICQVRNPGIDRKSMEIILFDNLGAVNVLWLGRGIVGDDTHGHVDDVCRFVNRNTVVLCFENNPSDENYKILHENRERLQAMRTEDGSRIDVILLPMPEPLFFEGQRLPASYANFYIANSVVIVPTFNDPSDRIALGILSEIFSDKKVVGINSTDLVWGLGTIHCMTQQQPKIS